MHDSCPLEHRAVNTLLSIHESGLDFDSQGGIPLISRRGLQRKKMWILLKQMFVTFYWSQFFFTCSIYYNIESN
jgi:hypothetical protein